MPISEETRRNRRRRDVVALVIHDAHCDEDTDCDGVDQDDLDRAANLIEGLDQIDAEMGYAPTCSTCGVTVYWPAESERGALHTNLDAAHRAAGGAHPVKLAGPVTRPYPSSTAEEATR